VDPQARFEELVNKLREREYRLTPQRIALLRLLAASDGHPSASHLYDQIKDQFPTTSLATVYKTLNVLKAIDEVLELGFSDGDNRYDGNKPYPHPHLVCINCQRILDVEISLAQDLVEEAAQSSGYQIVSHRLDFYGLCPDCQNGA
jgi:Fur family peroxide stress response transcriptional regulator